TRRVQPPLQSLPPPAARCSFFSHSPMAAPSPPTPGTGRLPTMADIMA
uniref:Uncharacterized protein n=1 Tax=Aegilops tauschii subsp. strangulata TaxID=200361 RepID=A0A453JXT8_AEGTS